MGLKVLVTGLHFDDSDSHERQFRYLTPDMASMLAEAGLAVRKAQEALDVAEGTLREQCESLGIRFHRSEITPRIYELDVDYASENLDDLRNIIVP